MEVKVSKKIDSFLREYKLNIAKKINELKLNEHPQINELITYIYEYENLIISNEDVTRKKRIKNTVPQFERCTAKRSNGEQCTRRRKDDECFCGTHIKGTPHGIINQETSENEQYKKVSVWIQEISGISYYIDNNYNVYNMEDIIQSKMNPRVIYKWKKSDDDDYEIIQ
tara:strand:- start:166 stop:672 length:507 start_codon:yes stop_codon:yes gene_type:complete